MVWYDANYGYKKKITVDHTLVGGDETDFPVLISVTDADLADTSNGGHVESANGYDIIFTNSAETVQLKHEIQRYRNTDGLLIFWVKVPSLSSTVDTDIYIYYGKAGVGADPSTTDTWDSNFMMVQHMDDASSPIVDSTSYGNDGTGVGTLNYQQTGKIGYAVDFVGVDDHFTVTRDNSIEPANLTLECWFRSDVYKNAALFAKDYTSHADPYYSYNFRLRDPADNDFFLSVVEADPYNPNSFNPAVGYTNLTWTYTAMSFDGTNLKHYKDDGAPENNVNAITITYHATDLYLGDHRNLDQDFNGKLDEMRISNTARSTNWIGTTYETQNTPAAFMSWGAEEEKPVGVGADIYYHDGTNNIELQRDDSSPIQMYNGTEIIGLKLGATDDANASAIHVYDGAVIKAILKMP